MAGTRRLTVVTVFTVTGLLFSGGALKAFADDHGAGGARGGDKHAKPRAVERTQPPTPAMTATPTATGTVTMTPTATPVVVEEEEEDFVTVINGVVFECEPTDNGQGRDHGRHLGEVKHEDDEEAFITVINGVQVI